MTANETEKLEANDIEIYTTKNKYKDDHKRCQIKKKIHLQQNCSTKK